MVDPVRMCDRGLYRRAGLAHQPHRLLVHAQHRVLLIVQPGIGFQDLVHGRGELGVVLRQGRADVQVDDLVLPLPGRAFLVGEPDSVLLTHSGS